MIKKGAGYTIVELMVVVTVTSVIALSAFTMIQGQQNRTQYSQAMRDIELKLVDIANDVNNGYYPAFTSGRCMISGPNLHFVGGGDGQGASSDCTFIGKAVHFAPQGSDKTEMNIYTLAGRRLDDTGQTVLKLSDAWPTPVASGALDITEVEETIYQLEFESFNPTTGVIVFLTGFGTESPSGDIVGNPTTDIYYLNGTTIDDSRTTVFNALDDPTNYVKPGAAGLELCLKYDNSKFGKLTFAENNRRFQVRPELDVASC